MNSFPEAEGKRETPYASFAVGEHRNFMTTEEAFVRIEHSVFALEYFRFPSIWRVTTSNINKYSNYVGFLKGIQGPSIVLQSMLKVSSSCTNVRLLGQKFWCLQNRRSLIWAPLLLLQLSIFFYQNFFSIFSAIKEEENTPGMLLRGHSCRASKLKDSQLYSESCVVFPHALIHVELSTQILISAFI